MSDESVSDAVSLGGGLKGSCPASAERVVSAIEYFCILLRAVSVSMPRLQSKLYKKFCSGSSGLCNEGFCRKLLVLVFVGCISGFSIVFVGAEHEPSLK